MTLTVHDEVNCITEAAAMFAMVLDQADTIDTRPPRRGDPADELRECLPMLLAELTPQAREVLRDWNSHMHALVAGLHQALRS